LTRDTETEEKNIEKKTGLKKKRKYKEKKIVGGDSLAIIHGICMIFRGLKLISSYTSK